MRTHSQMTDGTWICEDHSYNKYRLEKSGRMPDAAEDSTFVYLSNLKGISFEHAYKAAGVSSFSGDYFSPEEAVLVEMNWPAAKQRPGAASVQSTVHFRRQKFHWRIISYKQRWSITITSKSRHRATLILILHNLISAIRNPYSVDTNLIMQQISLSNRSYKRPAE